LALIFLTNSLPK